MFGLTANKGENSVKRVILLKKETIGFVEADLRISVLLLACEAEVLDGEGFEICKVLSFKDGSRVRIEGLGQGELEDEVRLDGS
jgi:hypothetical protein